MKHLVRSSRDTGSPICAHPEVLTGFKNMNTHTHSAVSEWFLRDFFSLSRGAVRLRSFPGTCGSQCPVSGSGLAHMVLSNPRVRARSLFVPAPHADGTVKLSTVTVRVCLFKINVMFTKRPQLSDLHTFV